MKNNSSLVLVGSGIKALSHLNTETKSYIRNADKVLYLLNEPVTPLWIKEANQNVESLDGIYFRYKKRKLAYKAISNYILDELRKRKHVCAVFYGHPCFFATPGLEAVKLAKAEGYDARILPAICSEDCLFSDLLIDPSSSGRQSYDATDFLLYKRIFDPFSHLLLYQVNSIGSSIQVKHHNNEKNIKILVDHLSRFYNADHKVILYSAAQYPGMNSRLTEIPLKSLSEIQISSIEILYVPPLASSKVEQEMFEKLTGMK